MAPLHTFFALSVLAFFAGAYARDENAQDNHIPDEKTGVRELGYEEYKTEPNFRPPTINVTYIHPDRSLLAPGYYFYAPFATGNGAGPSIIDQDGQLIWWGASSTLHQAKDFQVCDYMGSSGNHLCWAEFSFNTLNQERSKNRVFDNTYSSVGRDYSTIGDFNDPNPHEFNMLPGGRTFLQAIYQMKPKDLTPFGGRKEGFIVDGCFQEVDVETGRPVFSWCALDHLDITETLLYLNIHGQVNYTEAIAGTGQASVPWDWFHFNAVDKNEEGDYLVSARHLSQIMKVAGKENNLGLKPGSIIWRLNNKGNQFEFSGNWTFSRQHHVRFVKTTATETTFALFNNGWVIRNKMGFANHTSSGQIITINNETMEVRLDHEYEHPDGGLAIALGSMQVMPPNGINEDGSEGSKNAVVGWGTVPHISEFHEDGRLLFHMDFAPPNVHPLSYRSWKFPWVGNPQYPPKLLPYSRTCTTHGEDSPLMAYVSWNGATEVASWRFYVSTTSSTGPWLPAGTFQRDGFETAVNLTSSLYSGFAAFAPYVSVEALDANGNVIGSTIADTFVPKASYADRCDTRGCYEPQFFKYREDQSCGKTCGRNLTPAWFVLLLVVVGIESLCYLTQKWWSRAVRINEIGQKILDRGLSGRYWDDRWSSSGGSGADSESDRSLELDWEEKKADFMGNGGRPMLSKREMSGYEKPGKISVLLKASGAQL